MKVIYYTPKWMGGGQWRVTFWTKEDKSNALTETFVTIEESKLRTRIENILGIKNFQLELVNEKRKAGNNPEVRTRGKTPGD